MVECYVGLGGNLTHSLAAMRRTVQQLAAVNGIERLVVSNVYRTRPVSEIAQPWFFNAVCQFECQLPLIDLWRQLEEIERIIGKEPKPKNAPRLIDIDLLFYGNMMYDAGALIVPHPKWRERLFVLAPLAEITDTVPLGINVNEILKNFSNPHQERVVVCGPLI